MNSVNVILRHVEQGMQTLSSETDRRVKEQIEEIVKIVRLWRRPEVS